MPRLWEPAPWCVSNPRPNTPDRFAPARPANRKAGFPARLLGLLFRVALRGCRMSTRTIEPIHIVLSDADGGYYRFGDLPRLIADALYLEHPDDDDEAQELQWMKHAIDGVEKYKRDLARAAGLTDGEPGYLHVVENSASKRPLELRTGAVLDAGLVHLDWLNEWGESRKPPHVFSTASAPEPQAATPAPVVADSASNAPAWTVNKPKRYNGYAAPLHRLLAAAYRDDKPCPTARDVVEAWRNNAPAEIAKVLPDGFDYYDAKGDTKTADLEAIRKAIGRMTIAR
jgi:hypothetical protein